ncbi:ubiquitin carboxyl-terminal hydrolase MINDY-1 [Aspergillus viridinutans]|uniref:Ubiquitin carboxyl-terminal hydrolase MINDY-1 n=1 Tax=Aspergillus viridinutans TaxID=75553 RepID=A0A9P3BQU6_ASPVI|nr:ubiquitin carboxyl-terminal hydrolase MINDY-1 [Aspergillus viridinutans]GIK00833.1 ubiquitin carboxyl-terminal hydrolase MINDY-1 [Aspergillus viridinutans]
MVLRKRAPPHLYSLNLGNARSEPRSPISPTSPTVKSATSPSPKLLTRPRRAKSSPHPYQIPSEDSIYSPDLNTSPAFDLMPLEQAQKSPVGTLSSETANPWADDVAERPDKSHSVSEHPPVHAGEPLQGPPLDSRRGDRVPSIVVAGTQRRMAANEWQEVNNSANWEPPIQLQSNNPFLKAKQSDENPWGSNNLRASHGDNSSDRLSQSEGYIPMTARLSLLDQSGSESPWAEERPEAATRSAAWENSRMDPHNTSSMPHAVRENGSTSPFQTSPIGNEHGYSSQYLQQTDHGSLAPGSGIETPYVTDSTMSTPSSHELIEVDEPSHASGEPTTQLLPQNTSAAPAPPLPLRPNADASQAPPLPLRNAALSELDEQQQNEQRSETYSIRHVNWTDPTGKLRESPVLVQNKNGPCPLLALVNTLVLRADRDMQPPIVRALRSKEQISLGLLIEALFDELTTRVGTDGELPDIEALSRFLTMLHTGMNVNPRLTLESDDAPGTFQDTDDIRLYGTFGVPLVHGWVASPASKADGALKRLAQYYEDVQLLPFRKQELEDRVFRGETLTWDEEQAMKDIHAIQTFTEIENATQLSTFGLDHLTEKMRTGTFSILFRNDHFSTVYKHPQRHQLFTLVTDAGYSNHAEIVWECLVDVNGFNAEFFSGDFRPVGHAPSGTGPSGPRTSSNRTNVPSVPSEDRTGALSPQEQADADYAYALSLQYQEEERRERQSNNQPRSQRASAPSYPRGASWGLDSTHQRSASVVNGSGSQATSDGRSSRLGPGASNNAGDVPPPSYEQAATRPAHLPRDSPHNALPQQARYQRHSLGRRVAPGPVAAGPGDRPKDRNKDCVVM